MMDTRLTGEEEEGQRTLQEIEDYDIYKERNKEWARRETRYENKSSTGESLQRIYGQAFYFIFRIAEAFPVDQFRGRRSKSLVQILTQIFISRPGSEQRKIYPRHNHM